MSKLDREEQEILQALDSGNASVPRMPLKFKSSISSNCHRNTRNTVVVCYCIVLWLKAEPTRIWVRTY